MRLPAQQYDEKACLEEAGYFLKLPLQVVFALFEKNIVPATGEQHILPDHLILNYLKQQTPHALAEACALAVGQDKTMSSIGNTQTSLRKGPFKKEKRVLCLSGLQKRC